MMLSTAKQRWLSLLLFAIAFGYFSIDMKLGELLIKPPWGIHQWRQTDGASMALLFHEQKHPIYAPHIHNQLHSEGEAGGEMPIVYYVAGKLYGWLGIHDYLIRWIHFALVVIGLLSFIWVFGNYLSRPLWAVIAVMLAFSAPTFMYYSANFLPDAGGFGLALIGIACLLQDHKQRHLGFRYAGFLLFVVSGWMKVSMLIPFLSFVGSVVLIDLFKHKEFKGLLTWILPSSLLLLLVFAWYGYIGWYNSLYDSTYFATGIRPIWSAEPGHVQKVMDSFTQRWITDVIPIWMRWTSATSIVLIILQWRRLPPLWRYWIPLTLLGVIAYFILFYNNLFEHDYYFLPIYFFTLLTHSAAVLLIDEWRFKVWHPFIYWGIFLLCGAVTYGAVAHSVKRNKKTYFGWYRDLDCRNGFLTIDAFLEENDVPSDAKMFVAQDFSSNQRLYFLRRKGWTQLSGIYESDQLDRLIDRGASYAVVPDTSFYSVTFLRYHISDTIGFHEGIGVYRIVNSPWWKNEVSESAK